MLILERKKSEVLSVEITRENLLALAASLQPGQSLRMALGVVDVRVASNSTRLALEFPREFVIHREEIDHTIRLQQAGLKNELTPGETLKGLRTRSMRERMRIRTQEISRAASAQQSATEPPCSLCGRPLLRCASHGDCVGRSVPAADSSTPALAGAAP